MVSGERAELRGLNLEGLRRRGFSVVEVHFLSIFNTLLTLKLVVEIICVVTLLTSFTSVTNFISGDTNIMHLDCF